MATHNVRLVILSVVVAIIASYTALSQLRVTVARACPHCAVVGWWCDLYGIGIWSMHFIAMLAYNLTDTNLQPSNSLSLDGSGSCRRGSSVRSQPRRVATVGSWGVFMGLVLRRCTTQAWQRCN